MKEEYSKLEKCNHKCKWKPLGVSGVMEAHKLNYHNDAQRQFIAVIFCEECGEIKSQDVTDEDC